MSQYEDRLKDYVDVKERIRLFYERFPDGRLTTDEVITYNSPDGINLVSVHAKAYRTVDDPRPADGWSWMRVPGTTNFTRGSELENTETSAWGRAIGALGIGIDKSIASANEIANKEGDDVEPPRAKGEKAAEADGLIGTATTQGTQDGQLRMAPEGFTLPFRVKDGDTSFIVLAENGLAETLDTLRSQWMGQRVTVWGSWEDAEVPAKGNKPAIRYRVLHLERIATADWTLPAVEAPTEELGL